MRVNFIFRNPKVGFSIGRVFDTICEEIIIKNEINKTILPHTDAGFLSLIKNGIYANRNSKSKEINHITGAEHYLSLFLFFKKNIVTVHDIMYYTSLNGFKKKIWKLIYIKTLRLANYVTFISEDAKLKTLEHVKLDSSNYCVIPNPVSKDFVKSIKIFNREKPVILHVGTLQRKNLIRTIKALRGIRCHLNIVGKLDKEILSTLEEVKVEFSNIFDVSDNDILNSYIEADIINFPSLLEGFGMPIIEGQATGRIVVTSNISPMKEVAGGAAVLVDPYSVESIRQGYLSILTNSIDVERMIEKGFDNAKRYNVEIIAEQYMSVYNKMSKD